MHPLNDISNVESRLQFLNCFPVFIKFRDKNEDSQILRAIDNRINILICGVFQEIGLSESTVDFFGQLNDEKDRAYLYVSLFLIDIKEPELALYSAEAIENSNIREKALKQTIFKIKEGCSYTKRKEMKERVMKILPFFSKDNQVECYIHVLNHILEYDPSAVYVIHKLYKIVDPTVKMQVTKAIINSLIHRAQQELEILGKVDKERFEIKQQRFDTLKHETQSFLFADAIDKPKAIAGKIAKLLLGKAREDVENQIEAIRLTQTFLLKGRGYLDTR